MSNRIATADSLLIIISITQIAYTIWWNRGRQQEFRTPSARLSNFMCSASNGGLFSPAKYSYIAHTPQPGAIRWEIGDHRLADVIDMLAYPTGNVGQTRNRGH
jgi:hypothetical protein